MSLFEEKRLQEQQAEVLNVEVMPDHMHLLVGCDPQFGIHRLVKLIKGCSSRLLRRAQKKLERLQQSLSRKKRGSTRRRRALKQVAKAHRKVANQRKDFLHKQSRCLVNSFGLMVFEELEPANMSKRPKPKQDENGTYLPNPMEPPPKVG